MDCQEEIQYELLQQNKKKSVKEEDSGVQKLTVSETEAKTADNKALKPFSARMTIRNIYYSSDSYSSDSESDSGSDCETKVIADIEAKTADTKEPKPFSARMTVRNIYYSSDSYSSGSESDSGSDCETKIIAEEYSEVQNSTIPNILASSILVKHGTKRLEEAGDKDSKRARTTQE